MKSLTHRSRTRPQTDGRLQGHALPERSLCLDAEHTAWATPGAFSPGADTASSSQGSLMDALTGKGPAAREPREPGGFWKASWKWRVS